MKNKSNISLKEIFSEAVQQYKKRNIKVAENYCIKILSIEPNHFDSIFMLATLSAIKNDYEKAKQLLHRAIKIQPENPSAYNNF